MNTNEPKDISGEQWRQYTWKSNGETQSVTITKPKRLWIGKTTHRVEDSAGLIHCVPTVGLYGCHLVWKPWDVNNPVMF